MGPINDESSAIDKLKRISFNFDVLEGENFRP